VAVSDDVRPVAPAPEYDRMPPQDLAAEQSVLGGMLLSKDAIADVVEVLKAGDFYKPAHATVFDAILDLYGRGEPADPVTVAAALADSGGLGRVGGASYLHTLISLVPTAANAGYYARIVSERAVLRRLIEAGTRIVQLGQGAASGQGRDVDDVVDMAQQAVYEVTERRTSEDYTVLEELLQPTMDEIEAIGAHGGVMSGVPTGFVDLDRLTNGLHAGQLIVVAARPGLGKCLRFDTLITISGTGERVTVAEFVRRGQAGEVLHVDSLGADWKLNAVRPSDFIHNGVRPVRRMTTRSGRSLSATANHPMRTLRGWVPLEELRPGDQIAVPRTVRVAATAEVPDTDLLPREVWDLVLAEKGTLSWAEVSERCGRPRNHNWHVGKQGIGRDRLAELAKALDSQPLRDLAESDVLWDPIVSIEPDGMAEVYDLTIDGTHNFVANDIVVHNSTFGLDVTRSASIRHGLTSAIFSLEMSKIEITMRLLSAEAKVPLHHLRSGQLSEDDWTKLARRMGEVSEAPLYIDDSPNMTMMEIRAKARRLKQRHDLRLIVLDYLQLMSSPKRTESRQQEVSELSRGLKLLAKELEVPVIAVSQLNRGPEQRTDKRPQLSDLRESGSIEQDADMVILLNREDYYEKESPRAGEADFIVAKHRNGPTDTITVAFQGHFSRFVDMSTGM
jgi:replicative DNA helicase